MTRLQRRRFAALLLALTGAGSAFAQAYPAKPISVVVPYAVGGTTDIVARIVTAQIGNSLGQTLVVENKAGGGGNIGWGTVARAAPDGYTLLTTEMSFTIAPSLGIKQPFDASKDFTHVVTAASAPHVLVINPGVPAKTVQEFIAVAKASPGKFNYGSGGNGTNTHLGGELFKNAAGVDLVHVPYKGAGAVLQDLMGGQVQALVTSLPTALPHIRSGKLRALMVTSDKRSPLLPDVPSAKEAGLPKVVMDFWVGFAVPAATPQPVVDKLNKAVTDALASADGRRLLAEQGLEPASNTPAQAAQLVQGEMKRWGAVVKAAGIKAD
ncbi:MAG: Bug family tripartite tricarboxylate transporter substrate binding protein [Aquincola tertiaricarbonis]|uniref:Bug family tripartite tricarboxylate transporter substrate binding protein n=1 Tax=Aquincola TaxID=391952 RepID=UPI000614FDE0|nr:MULTISPECIES: tripartite tricarboxylate transporter substrate binding protein [Aquincola]MCR5867768.1 tripartite tricarboxylate transporter substrate binding protein [Aquincola sp. J276]